MEAKTVDLRLKSKLIIQSLLRGEEISLTYHGKPIAMIIPNKIKVKKKNSRKKLSNSTKSTPSKIFGMWSDYKEIKNVDEYVRQLRKARF
jgi:antitoxin (DNA-binding transcriptional repressor) of toxin-antitoxin stability system